jgi:enterobactin synthetase component D
MGAWGIRESRGPGASAPGDPRHDGAPHGRGTWLLPPWVACATAVLDSAAVGAAKRRREFEAGRTCAAGALAAIGAEATTVGVGAAGEPIWPAETTGSISHSDRLAIAVAAPRARARAIGIDVETVMSSARLCAVADRIAAPGEIDAVAARAGCRTEVAATLVFSAKESLFKCLFAEVGRVFDYLDAELCDVDLDRGSLRLGLTTTLAEGWRVGAVIPGAAAIADDMVYTAVVLDAHEKSREQDTRP